MKSFFKYMLMALIVTELSCGKSPKAPAPGAVRLGELRCEALDDPLGIDTPRPRLSWIMEAAGGAPAARGQRQTAYRVLAASSPEILSEGRGDLWDSGRVESDQSIHVEYAGRALASGERCYWTVQAWDRDGKPTPWSDPAVWSMGLLDAADWKAQWIGLKAAAPSPAEERRLPARYLRREFTLDKEIAQATAYISGLGMSELYVNGRRAGNDALSPGLTEYDKRVFYVTHDVTDLLKPGPNAAGVILGNGRYHAPRTKVPTLTRDFGLPSLLLQIDIRFRDGTSATIASDGGWRATDKGPITANNEYDGEEYDARLELPGLERARLRRRGLDGCGPDGGAPRPAGGADDRAHPRDQKPAPGRRDEPAARRLHLRHGSEHGRLVPAPGFAGPRAPRSRSATPKPCGPTARFTSTTSASAKAADTYTLKGDGRGVLRAAVHLSTVSATSR